jgi:hypothetical protein
MVQETRQQFSVNKVRAIALLQNAIRTLEERCGAGGCRAAEIRGGAGYRVG